MSEPATIIADGRVHCRARQARGRGWATRRSSHRFDLGRLEDPSMKAELATVYPEAVPVGALRSAFADA